MKTFIYALAGTALALSMLFHMRPAAARDEMPDMTKFCRSYDKETTETLRRLMSYEAHRRSRDPEVRLMAVGESWETIIKKCRDSEFADVSNPVGWIRTVVQNNVYEQRRKYCRQVPGDQALEHVNECLLESLNSLEDEVAKSQKLQHFLNELSPRVREVAIFMLCGASEAETAKEMGINEATVSSHRQTIWRTCRTLKKD